MTKKTDNPEWTDDDFKRAKPASEVLPQVFSKKTADTMLKPKRGRPRAKQPKEQINIRFSAEVVEYFRASGSGWQTRMDAALKDWIKKHPRKREPA